MRPAARKKPDIYPDIYPDIVADRKSVEFTPSLWYHWIYD